MSSNLMFPHTKGERYAVISDRNLKRHLTKVLKSQGFTNIDIVNGIYGKDITAKKDGVEVKLELKTSCCGKFGLTGPHGSKRNYKGNNYLVGLCLKTGQVYLYGDEFIEKSSMSFTKQNLIGIIPMWTMLNALITSMKWIDERKVFCRLYINIYTGRTVYNDSV